MEGFTLSDFDDIVALQAQLGGKGHFFFDGIQNLDGWEKFARSLGDAKQHVCITGSNAKMLSRDIAERLGGRYISIDVPTYSFPEYLEALSIPYDSVALSSTRGRAKVLAAFNEYLHWGGLPETLEIIDKRMYISSLYQRVLLSDVILRSQRPSGQA